MDITNSAKGNTYRLGRQVADDKKYRVYLCEDVKTSRRALLQVAAGVEFNGDIDRSAFILRLLTERAEIVEAGYLARVSKNPERDRLNYELGFPEVLDSFRVPSQGDRRVNILSFRHVDDLTTVIPLINLTEIDRVRVDLRTSIWIMGKLLKQLTFLHSEGISVNLINGKNVLIQPDQHYVILFDWSCAKTNDSVPSSVRREEIAAAAQTVIAVMGGDFESEVLPNDGEEAYDAYRHFLFELAAGREASAAHAHKAFYALVDSFWPRGFHLFTVKPLDP